MSGAQRELKVTVGVDFDGRKAEADSSKSAEEVRKQWSDALGTVRNLVLGLGAAFTAAAVHVTEMATQIDRGAAGLGVSTDQFQRLQYAAQAAGLEANDLGESMGALAQRAQDAASGGGAAQTFRDLGVSVADASGNVKSANDLFLEAADALQRMGPGTRQTAAALQLFGEKGRRLLPVLGQGRAGVQALFDEFDQLGGGIDDEAIQATRDFSRELLRTKVSLTSAFAPVLNMILPVLGEFARKARDVVGALSHIFENSTVVRASLIALAGIVAGLAVGFGILASESIIALAPIYAAAFGAALAITAIALAIDDVMVTMDGGDSAIRDFIDSLFGVGTTAAAVDGLRVVFDGIGSAIDGAVTAIQPLVTWIDQILTKLGGMAATLSAMRATFGGLASIIPGGSLLGLGGGAVQGLAAVGRQQEAQNMAARPGTSPLANPVASPAFSYMAPPSMAAAASPRPGAMNANVQGRSTITVSGVVTEEALVSRINAANEAGQADLARQIAAELARGGR